MKILYLHLTPLSGARRPHTAAPAFRRGGQIDKQMDMSVREYEKAVYGNGGYLSCGSRILSNGEGSAWNTGLARTPASLVVLYATVKFGPFFR